MSMNVHHCCIVFSNDKDAAFKKLDEIFIEKGSPDSVRRSRSEFGARDRYDDEEWVWVRPCDKCRGKRAHKAYIDVNLSIKALEVYVKPLCCLYCKDEDFEFFNW